MDRGEMKDVIVEAMEEYDRRKNERELSQSGGWRVVEYILIVLFGVGMILLSLNIPIAESDHKYYSVIEMYQKINDDEAQAREFNKDLAIEQKLEQAKFYASQAGFIMVIGMIIGLTVMMLANARYHTRKEIIDKLVVLLGFVTLLLTMISIVLERSS